MISWRAWLPVLLVVFSLASCDHAVPGSPGEAFESLITCLETGDAERLDGLLSEDFVGASNRETTMAFARQAFGHRNKMRITILSQDEQDHGASATFRTKMLIVSGRGLVPRYSARLQVDTQWKKTKSGWILRVAQWHRI